MAASRYAELTGRHDRLRASLAALHYTPERAADENWRSLVHALSGAFLDVRCELRWMECLAPLRVVAKEGEEGWLDGC